MAIVGEPVSPETVMRAGVATTAEPGVGNGPGRQPARGGEGGEPGQPVTVRQTAVDNESPAFAAAWHPVADAAELGDEPLSVMLLGRAWVLVRIGGEVRAFEDLCPHRRAPLSAGWVEDGQLRCRYHGWSFATDGHCTLIPANGPGVPIPPRACLRRPAGVAVRYGLVWLAPEPPVCDVHPFPEWDDPGFDRSWSPPRRTPAGAAQLADTFLDAAHCRTVPTSPGLATSIPSTAYPAGPSPAVEVGPHQVERDGWEVRTVYEAPDRSPDLHPLGQPHVLTKVGRPAAAVRLTLDFPLTGDRLAVLFACQPETRDSTRVYKLMARSGYDGDPARLAELVRYETVVLEEDLAVSERHRDPSSTSLSASALSVAYRQLLGDLVDHHGPPPTASPR